MVLALKADEITKCAGRLKRILTLRDGGRIDRVDEITTLKTR